MFKLAIASRWLILHFLALTLASVFLFISQLVSVLCWFCCGFPLITKSICINQFVDISKVTDPDVMFQKVMTKDGRSYALVNHIINTEYDLGLRECVAVCLSDVTCKSINYGVSTRVCEMNNETKHGAVDGDWIERPGNDCYHVIYPSMKLVD